MILIISPVYLSQIHHHLQSAYPQEGCGVILGRTEGLMTTVHQVIPTINVWYSTTETDRSLRDRYEIDPNVMLATMKSAREMHLEIVGIYHSHPDHPAIPSECDRSLAWPQYIYLICSVDRGTVCATTAWQLDGPLDGPLDDDVQFRSVEIQMA